MKSTVTILSLLIISAVTLFGQSLEIGQEAPDIVLKSPEGKELHLSSLKGQMVLIDFWASWCAPCRKENPLLVQTYRNYKDAHFKNGDGFTVFSVSMDMNPKAWKIAIRKDSLDWPNHVSDLKGWKSEAAQLYHITAIPFCYLIDGDGIVVAINPRGEKLDSALKKLKKKRYSGTFEKQSD